MGPTTDVLICRERVGKRERDMLRQTETERQIQKQREGLARDRER